MGAYVNQTRPFDPTIPIGTANVGTLRCDFVDEVTSWDFDEWGFLGDINYLWNLLLDAEVEYETVRDLNYATFENRSLSAS